MQSLFCKLTWSALALLLPAAAASAQSIQPAHAADEEDELALVYGDKSMISIATGSEQAVRRAPAVATVITAEDIAAMGLTNLDQVMETVPGIHVTHAPGFYASNYLVRGLGSGSLANPQVLVLQNGVSLSTLYNGGKGQIWGGLPLENVARIEIIRGPVSALYGADAYAGVINIITKSASQIEGTRAGVRVGSYSTRDAWVQHGRTAGPVTVAAYLRAGRSDGHRGIVAADAQSRLDAIFGTRASLAPGPVQNQYEAIDGSLDLGMGKWRFRTDYKLRDRIGNGAGVASALDPASTGMTERITSDLSWTDPNFAPGWTASVSAAYMQFLERMPDGVVLFPPGARFPTGVFPSGVIGGPSRSERQWRFSAYAIYSGLAGHLVRFGTGHEDLDLYDAKTFKNYLLNAAGVPVPTGPVIDYNGIQPHILPHRRKVDYLYLQDEWKFLPDWTLTAGVRHDRYSDFGSTTNPRLALVWETAHNLTSKLLYGRAFRAPSFNEAYGINPVANGNPDLRPETIGTLEAAFSLQADQDTQVNLNIFRYDAKDLIRAVPNTAPAPGATFGNAARQRGTGLELSVVRDVSRYLRVTGNYAFQRSIDATTGRDAGYAPRHHLYTRAEWQMQAGWMLTPQLNWVAGRRRAAGDLRAPIADYKTLDLTLRRMRGDGQWEYALSVRNLLDADVREPTFAPGQVLPNDLPMPGRAVYLQASYRM